MYRTRHIKRAGTRENLHYLGAFYVLLRLVFLFTGVVVGRFKMIDHATTTGVSV